MDVPEICPKFMDVPVLHKFSKPVKITAYQSHFSIGRFLVGNLDTGKQGSYLFF